MIFTKTPLIDAWIIDLERRGDARGFFARTMCADEFAEHGLVTGYVQQNTAFSADKGTLRGLHLQRGSAAEAKLVRCLRGAIFDVIVDLRPESPTYLKHAGYELTGDNRRQLHSRSTRLAIGATLFRCFALTWTTTGKRAACGFEQVFRRSPGQPLFG